MRFPSKDAESPLAVNIVLHVRLDSFENAQMDRLHSRNKSLLSLDDFAIHPTEFCTVKRNRHRQPAPNKI